MTTTSGSHGKKRAISFEVLHRVVDSLPGLVFLHDPDMRLTYANRAYLERAGAGLAEAVGRPYWELFPKGAGPLVSCAVARDNKAEESAEEEIELDSGDVFLSCQTSVWDATTNSLHGFHILSDITDQRRREREADMLRRINEIFLTSPADDMYADVLQVILDAENSPHGVFGYLDEEGDLVVPSMTREVFWRQCNVPNKDIVFPRETWGTSTWCEALRKRRPFHSNRPSKVSDGHVPMNRHISMPIVFQNESIGLLQVANREADYGEEDIAFLRRVADAIAPVLNARIQRDRHEKARLAALEALAASEARQRLLLENLPQRIFFKDRQSTYVTCNKHYARDLELAGPDAIAGKTDFDFYSKELAEKYRVDDRHVMDSDALAEEEEPWARDG